MLCFGVGLVINWMGVMVCWVDVAVLSANFLNDIFVIIFFIQNHVTIANILKHKIHTNKNLQYTHKLPRTHKNLHHQQTRKYNGMRGGGRMLEGLLVVLLFLAPGGTGAGLKQQSVIFNPQTNHIINS